jgi:creatinine amidohydrolase
MSPIKLDELTYPQVSALLKEGRTSILWPVGTLEAHGRHAPVGTDNFCAEEIAWALGDRLDWPVAPTLNYGITTGLIAYPGSVRIDKALYSELVGTIFENFFQMGFRRIVVINGHGGNTETLGKVAKEMITEDRGKRHFIIIDWWQLGEDALKEVYNRPGGHAALDETACMVAFRPELLDQDALDPSEHVAFTGGVISVPYSAAMLYYSEDDAAPDFDPDKAGVYMNKVLDRIESTILAEVERFEDSFPQGGG